MKFYIYLHIKETLAKMSISQLGNKNGIGHNHSDDIKEKIGAPKRKKVIDTKTGVVYNSINEAAEAFSLSSANLSRYLSGARPNKTTLKKLN